MAKHTIQAQMAAIDVAIRAVPHIAKGLRMSPAMADLLKQQLQGAMDILRWVEDNEKGIREDVLAKRRVA